MEVAVEKASASASSSEPYIGEEDDGKRKQVKVRRRTLRAVLEQCQRALEMLEDADLDDPTAAACGEDDDDLGEKEMRSTASLMDTKNEGDPSYESPSAATDSETDELCDLLKSKIESPSFLEKLGSIHNLVPQNVSGSLYLSADESTSWDVVTERDLWEEKNKDGENESAQDSDYVLVMQEDIMEGIACFMAAYLLSLKQTKELTPNQLQEALCKTFSVNKRKGKLRKAWDGGKVMYNVASWGATAIGIYQNPALLRAASVAFWTSCRVISKLF